MPLPPPDKHWLLGAGQGPHFSHQQSAQLLWHWVRGMSHQEASAPGQKRSMALLDIAAELNPDPSQWEHSSIAVPLVHTSFAKALSWGIHVGWICAPQPQVLSPPPPLPALCLTQPTGVTAPVLYQGRVPLQGPSRGNSLALRFNAHFAPVRLPTHTVGGTKVPASCSPHDGCSCLRNVVIVLTAINKI